MHHLEMLLFKCVFTRILILEKEPFNAELI